jgi:hypothetical protein
VRDAQLWEMVGELAAATRNAVVLTSDLGADTKESLIRKPDDYIPAHYQWPKPKRRKKKAKPDKDPLLSTLAARYGPKA